MIALPRPLAPLGAYHQWVTYTTRPRGDGKLDKIPTNYATGQPCNAHDPVNWTDYETAQRIGGAYIGFVFTDHDPFWFLDVDSCLTEAGWSLVALDLIESLPGAAWEVSLSGTGLHAFGSGKLPENHRTRGIGLELYHTGRFVAITGTNAVGDALTDCTAAMVEVVNKYFGYQTPVTPASWTVGPDAAWRGPVNDDDLIRRACNARSTGSMFSNRVSFADLWDADPVALGKSWPDASRPYDASSADAALAQHLAFWTGKNCERIRSLMLKSRMVRDKWNRDDYLPRTIIQAVAQQRDVCTDKPTSITTPLPTAAPEPLDVNGETILNAVDQKMLFTGSVYISDVNEILAPGGHQYDKSRFDTMFGGYGFVMDPAGTKTGKSAWECFTNSRLVKFPKVKTSEFAPERPPGGIWETGGDLRVNSYWPVVMPRTAGDPGPFLRHLSNILPVPGDRAIILSYMAAVVQHPGHKFQWCPVVQGVEGNGKTLLSRCLRESVGLKYYHMAKPAELNSRFNDFLLNKIFVSVEDIFRSDKHEDVIEALTAMITNDFIEVEPKGIAKQTRRVCANFLVTCNPKDAVRKTIDGRKFSIFFTAQQSKLDLVRDGMQGKYFPDLYEWLRTGGYAIVNNYLRTYQIPEALNPATECHRAPVTSSTDAAVTESAGRLEQEILYCIEQEMPGFRGGWISSHFLDRLVADRNLERYYPRNKRPSVLLELGYVPHPSLPGGQTHNPISPDGVRPRLYVKRDHPYINSRPAEATRHYCDAQVNVQQPSPLALVA